jgi:hypothetical protein
MIEAGRKPPPPLGVHLSCIHEGERLELPSTILVEDDMDIDLTASAKDIEWIAALARKHPDVEEISDPTALDASRVLNMGLPHFDLQHAQEAFVFLTVVFKSGSAGLAFFKSLREQLKTRSGAVVVSDSVTGKPKGEVRADTSDEKIKELA